MGGSKRQKLHCIACHYISLNCIALHRIVSYRIVSYRIVSYRIVSYRIVSYRIVSYRIVSYRIVSYRIVSYRIVLYCIVLYCIVLYCIVLYCIVLYCIVLYCIVLYGASALLPLLSCSSNRNHQYYIFINCYLLVGSTDNTRQDRATYWVTSDIPTSAVVNSVRTNLLNILKQLTLTPLSATKNAFNPF